MPCQCGYPDGMSPLGRMVLPRAPPSGKPSSHWETFHQDTHAGMAYLYNGERVIENLLTCLERDSTRGPYARSSECAIQWTARPWRHPSPLYCYGAKHLFLKCYSHIENYLCFCLNHRFLVGLSQSSKQFIKQSKYLRK